MDARTDKDSKVSVIIVNWNGRRFLHDCLASLSVQSYTPDEIIVVDNGSTDDSVFFVKDRFPRVRVIEVGKNAGFTGGNTAGLEVARGEFVALLNNDTRVEKNWLENLIRPMIVDPKVGICASKIFF